MTPQLRNSRLSPLELELGSCTGRHGGSTGVLFSTSSLLNWALGTPSRSRASGTSPFPNAHARADIVAAFTQLHHSDTPAATVIPFDRDPQPSYCLPALTTRVLERLSGRAVLPALAAATS
ncbi:hypothetical protein K466DRAFT_250458 [Polyporus arcularius HHB13444]|uniref:Uncharacterized protein n=1 Tax=Polyporus arcularius HHB13444 TaxID=1314778 RepID=A0A5C3P3A8_9APHY|nr:hypothetical protein K466DRAFT_250458 [Polyporus arcularius HHB13444]